MSAKPEANEPAAKVPVKSKKLLVIIGAAVLVVALLAGGAFFYISKQRAAAEDGEDAPVTKSASESKPKAPPVYLPLDSMVVNLADPGGEKVAQIGVILEVADAHASDTVKAYLPTIRSGVLMLISQRTAEELLKPEGKEKLSKDILRQALLPFVGDEDPEEEDASHKKKKKSKKADKGGHADVPVVGVLFSSFIVQ